MKEEFCYCDLWAAEAYVTALDSGETTLLQMLEGGIKIHQWLLDWITKKAPQEVKKYKFGYHNAKQFVHALNYGIAPKGMSRESQLPIDLCQMVYTFYHSEFPGIKARLERVREQLKVSRKLRSLLGRQKYFFGPFTQDMFKDAYAWPSQSVIGELNNIAFTKLYYHSEPWILPCLNTHDGTVSRVFKNNREEYRQVIKAAYSIPLTKNGVTIRIPIEVGFGDNFDEIGFKRVERYSDGS